MSTTDAKEFHDFLESMKCVIKKLDRGNLTDDEKQTLTLNLTEVYFGARKVSNHIASIAGRSESQFSEKTIDYIETALINLKIEIFDELIEWMNGVQEALNSVIEKIGNRNSAEGK